MKKLLGSTLALAMFLPVGASAELLKNFKASGSVDVDAINANNVKDLSTETYDHMNTVQTRVMVGADWDLLDDVHAKVTLNKNNRTYGSASESLTGVQGATTFEQAYTKIDKLFGAIDATLGRQFYGEAGDPIIYFGPRNDFGLTVTALDGGRFDWNGEKVGVTLLGAKLGGASTLASASDTGDKNLWGLDVHAKPMDNLTGGAYVYRKTTVNSGNRAGIGVVGNDILYVAGVKAKATMGGAWVKGEYAKNFGQERTISPSVVYAKVANYTGWMARVNGGVKADLSNVGALTGWADAGMGTGDAGANGNRAFQAIAGDYRPGGIAGRFWSGSAGSTDLATGSGLTTVVDNGTLSNRVNIGAGAKFSPAALSKLTAGLSWWNYRVKGVSSTPSAKGDVFLGNEYDLDLNWAHSENVSVSAGVGTFQPGRAYITAQAAPAAGIRPATLGYADFAVKF